MPAQTPIVRAVLFDMDGVLVDSYEAWFELIREAVARHGFAEVTRQRFAQTWGQGVDADAATFFPGYSTEQVDRIFHQQFAAHVNRIEVIDGAATTVQSLRNRGIKTAVVTNTPMQLARETLAHAELVPDELVTSSDVERAKPAPDMVLRALALLDVEPRHACVVGDSRFDQQAAAAAGVRFIGFRRDGDARVESLAALLALVAGMTQVVTFDQVRARWDWRPIPSCPGRLKLAKTSMAAREIVGADLVVQRHQVPAARDIVLVVRLDRGGLISYQQSDGAFVHTLGDEDGFARKLEELGIATR